MIRKIAACQLVPGMYVASLHASWFQHSLWRRRFLVRDEATVLRLIEDGIAEVSIDTDRGTDLPPPPALPVWEFVPAPRQRPDEIPKSAAPSASLDEERPRAQELWREAATTVRSVMAAVKAGKPPEPGRLEPIVEGMMESVRRHPDGLVPLARFKAMAAYASEHAVATAALTVALARQQHLSRMETERTALGALVKDVGQESLDARVVAKAGGLSQDELSLLRFHVEIGIAVLEESPPLPDTSLAVVLEHHERFDGSGYPCALAGEGISLAGRMAALADSYDAMISDRPYRPALSPAAALRRVYGGGGTLFDPALAAGFVRTLGVYPVGTLVRLESGHLAVVEEVHHDDILHPVVRVIFHAGRRQYVTPVRVDLARRYGNPFGRIVRSEEFKDWGISPAYCQGN